MGGRGVDEGVEKHAPTTEIQLVYKGGTDKNSEDIHFCPRVFITVSYHIRTRIANTSCMHVIAEYWIHYTLEYNYNMVSI